MLLKFKKWALVLTIVDVQPYPLLPTLYNVPYPLLFPASRKPGAGPLGTLIGYFAGLFSVGWLVGKEVLPGGPHRPDERPAVKDRKVV